MSFGSDGTHFVVGRGKDDRPWTERKLTCQLASAVCCLLHSPSLRQGLGEFRRLPCLLRADFTECPGPLLLWQWVREHEVGKQLGWKQREDKSVQETAGQSFQKSCYHCLLLWSERKQARVRWLRGTQRWEKKRSQELQHQNRFSFWMTQSRFRVS